MQNTLNEVKGDMAVQMLPPSSNSASDLLEAYRNYLVAEQAILDGPMKAIVDNIDDGRPVNRRPPELRLGQRRQPAPRWKGGRSRAQEYAAFGKLTQAQTAYTGEHNYQPMGLSDYIASEKAGK